MTEKKFKPGKLLLRRVHVSDFAQAYSRVITIVLLIGTYNAFAIKPNPKPVWHLKGNGIYEVKVADATLEVDANHGARIISFRLNDSELLSTNKINAENYGSTLWLSPQIWKWPPSPVLDAEPYRVKMHKEELQLASEADDKSGYKMSKTIVANRSDSSFSMHYTITNISEKEKSVAPWEVTRVPAGGLTFFPIGTPGGYSKSNLATEDLNGICWFNYNPELVTGHQKLFRNGSEGWLAHARNGLILIKQFPDIGIGQEAPNETEVEVYANKDRSYIELEDQGAYQTLRPGESFTWNVKWYLRKLPPKIEVKPGSIGLSDFVRKTIH